ncbi:hypothetical protein [Streptomyces fungicidicus]|uniref:hypothetical protein n=1 Tax=Streptomyces fungicidicus TaxID=68203 RepID=UPI0036D186DC
MSELRAELERLHYAPALTQEHHARARAKAEARHLRERLDERVARTVDAAPPAWMSRSRDVQHVEFDL